MRRWGIGLWLVLGAAWGTGGSGCGDDSSSPDDGGGGGDADADGADVREDVGDADIGGIPPGCRGLPGTQVIAIWDVVPFQVLSAPTKLGVVGFHEEGLDVVFAVDGLEAARAEDPTYNDLTDVWEYWFEFDPSAHADGAVTIAATAEPDCPGHMARELPDLVVYANSGGTLTNDTVRWADCAAGSDETGDGTEASPYATIEKAFGEVGAGGTVNLKAGTCYRLTDDLPAVDYDRWTTVRPAPGVSRDQVDILTYGPTEDSTGRFGENLVRWQDVKLHKDVEPGYSTIFYFESDHFAWLDGAELYDARGRWNGGLPANGNQPFHVYYTAAYIHDIQNVMCWFARNVELATIGEDIFRGSSDLLGVNVTVRGIDPGTTEAHPDYIQFYNPDDTVDNLILYNTRVYDMNAQGIFGGPGMMRNIAFVNLLMEKDPPESYAISQLTGDWDHLLMWHVTTVDSGMMLREPENIRNAFVIDGLYATLGSGSATSLPGWTIDHNLVASLVWDQTAPMGTNALVGDPGFADVATDDYHLGAGSPAAGAGIPLPGVPVDLDNAPWNETAPSLGAFETSAP